MKLSGQQEKIYTFFKAYDLGTDIPITSIFFRMETKNGEGKTLREKQQQVGSAVSRLNSILRDEGFEIVPGALKRTYRLTEYAKK